MQGKLSIERMCQLASVSRAGFYRSLQEQEPSEEDMEVRSTIQKIFAEHKRRYGYRRVSAELRRRGMLVNHKRVARLMREDNLLAVQPKAFMVTTDSDHQLEVYLNLAGRMKLTGVKPALGSGHHLHTAASRVGVSGSGSDPGRFLAQGSGLGTGSDISGAIAYGGLGESDHRTKAAAGDSSSFRSRRPVCVRRLCRLAAEARHGQEHEPASEPLRQRQLRELHEDAEERGDLGQQIPRSGTSAREHRRVHRPLLQSRATAFGARLQASRRVRAVG